MDFLNILKQRESCRSYLDKPVSRDDIMKILEAGRLSPSGCNAQPWKFMVIDTPEGREHMCDALVVENGKTGVRFRHEVPAFIAIMEQPARVVNMVVNHYHTSQRYASSDIGMAALNMCYEAMSLGLSTCMLGVIDQEKMGKYFGVPETCDVRVVIAIGYSAEGNTPRPKVRKSLDEICCFNHWE